jgi:hypothetical protein
MIEWDDLSDSELGARLRQRGLTPYVVEQLVDYRDEVAVAERITPVPER